MASEPPARPEPERPEPERPPRRERAAVVEDPERRAAAARSLFDEGLRRFVGGDTAGAIAKYQAAVGREPRFAPAHRGLGMAFERQGDAARAARAYRRYLELSPAAPDAAQIRERLGRITAAPRR